MAADSAEMSGEALADLLLQNIDEPIQITFFDEENKYVL